LVVALRLKKGGPASPNDTWPDDLTEQLRALHEFARNELLPHFSLEEDIVFPFIRSITDEKLTQLVESLQKEHDQMRDLLESLQADKKQMSSFGELLERHIRTEERQLFPQLEQAAASLNINIPLEEIAIRHQRYEQPPAC
jgi:iron-sulfur cluster repair protein YtfE (RIC family)